MSPHVRQSGGISRGIEAQHESQTGPASGRSSTRAQAAHRGAIVTATTASITRRATVYRDRDERITGPPRSQMRAEIVPSTALIPAT
jgi:hypothetical protein